MALKDAIYGANFIDESGAVVDHVGLAEQVGTPNQFKASICWSTSQPVSADQIMAEKLQFKNISMTDNRVGAIKIAKVNGSYAKKR